MRLFDWFLFLFEMVRRVLVWVHGPISLLYPEISGSRASPLRFSARRTLVRHDKMSVCDSPPF